IVSYESQNGGLIGEHVSTYQWHHMSTNNVNVINQVRYLLDEPKNAAAYSQTGFHPRTIEAPNVLRKINANLQKLTEQIRNFLAFSKAGRKDAKIVVAYQGGENVRPGDKVNLTITCDPSLIDHYMLISSEMSVHADSVKEKNSVIAYDIRTGT